MRILLVTDWNRGRGGAEHYIAALRDGLRAMGDDVRLLTSSAGTAGDGRAEYVAFGTESAAAQAFLQVVNPFAFFTVRRAVREFRPDVAVVNMFAHHLSPAALVPLDDVPSVLLVSDYKCICPLGSKLLPDGTLCTNAPGWNCVRRGCLSLPHWIRDIPRYALLRSRVARFTRILTCSEWVRDTLDRHGIFAESLILPSPAPTPKYGRDPAPSPQLLYVGRLDREKGVDLLLRSFAALPERGQGVELRIAGQGPLRGGLHRLATALGVADRVRFLDWLDDANVERELAKAWALVVPSMWPEPLGLVAIEAVIRGVPVVASEHGGLAEIVEPDVTGLLVPNGDGAALTDRLLRIVTSAAFPEHRLPEAAVERARRRFDQSSHVRALRSMLVEVTANPPSVGTLR